VNRLFFDINVSQASAATYVSCGGIFISHFTANLPRTLVVKKFWKTLRFDRIMAMSLWSHFLAHPVVITLLHIAVFRFALLPLQYLIMPSVLWRCWLGGRKGIRPVKKQSDGVLAWLSVWSEMLIWPSWCHCSSPSLASVKSRLVLSFCYRLTQVVLEKGPLNGWVCVCAVFKLCA